MELVRVEVSQGPTVVKLVRGERVQGVDGGNSPKGGNESGEGTPGSSDNGGDDGPGCTGEGTNEGTESTAKGEENVIGVKTLWRRPQWPHSLDPNGNRKG